MTAQNLYTEQQHFLDELESSEVVEQSKEEKPKTSLKEQYALKRKELVLKIESVENKINQSNIDEQVKSDLLFSVAEIKELASLFTEVVRLADVVYKITKNEEKDIYFKTILKKALFRIYLS